MTREVDGHSNPCTQSVAGPPTTTGQGGDHHWWDLDAVRCKHRWKVG